MKLRFILASVLLAMSAQVNASVTYTYEGANYDLIQDATFIPGSYDASMKMTGWIEFAAPLEANLVFENISASVLDFSFFDGRNTIDKGNADRVFFVIWTDTLGSLSQWVSLFLDVRAAGVHEEQNYIEIRWDGDKGEIKTCECDPWGFNQDRGSNTTSGTFAVAPVPVPAAALLFSSAAIGGLAFLRRCSA